MLLALSMQPKEVLDAGSKAAGTLTQTVLGSMVVILVITTGVGLWLAWRAKQGELNTVRELLEAHADEKIAAKDLAMEQTKAYQDLADVVEDHGRELEHLKEDLGKAVRDGDGASTAAIQKLEAALTASMEKLGKRVDSLAGAVPGVDTKKYYEGRD